MYPTNMAGQQTNLLTNLFYKVVPTKTISPDYLLGEKYRAKEYGMYDYKQYIKNQAEYNIYTKILDKINVLHQIYNEAEESADYRKKIREHIKKLKTISGINEFANQNKISLRSPQEFYVRLSRLLNIQPFVPLVGIYGEEDFQIESKSKIADQLTSFAVLVNRHLSFGGEEKCEHNPKPNSWESLIKKGMIAMVGDLKKEVMPVVNNYCTLTSKNIFEYQRIKEMAEIYDTIYEVSINKKISIPVYASTLTALTAEKGILLIPHKNHISQNLLFLLDAVLSEGVGLYINKKEIRFPKQNVIVLRISDNECEKIECPNDSRLDNLESNILRCNIK